MITLSGEQEQAANSRARVVLVEALAGTGKSTLLESIAIKHPNARVLYLTFNTDRAQAAKESFPPCVKVSTFHSYVWGFYKDVYQRMAERLSIYSLNRILPDDLLAHTKQEDRLSLIWLAVDTIERFCASIDIKIGMKHISDAEAESRRLSKRSALTLAKQIWNAMVNPQFNRIPITFDAILKLFLIQKKRMAFDIILCDETQDFTPCMTAIVFSQRHSQQIYVADRHQQINSFRYACDSFSLINEMSVSEGHSVDQHILTQSFRSSNKIIHCAKHFLKKYKATEVDYKGLLLHSTIGPVTGRRTELFRTNAGLINQLMKLTAQGVTTHVVGALAQYDIVDLADLFFIQAGMTDKVVSKNWQRTNSLSEIKDQAILSKDNKILSLIKIVESNNIGFFLDFSMAKQSVDEKNADVILTTGHKAKGREYDAVKMGDDYYHPDYYLSKQETDELNGIYVAMTRAKTKLELPMSWYTQ